MILNFVALFSCIQNYHIQFRSGYLIAFKQLFHHPPQKSSMDHWKDSWIPLGPNFPAPQPSLPIQEYQKVYDLLNAKGNNRDSTTLNEPVQPNIVSSITTMPLCSSNQGDFIQQILYKDRSLTVKLAYWISKSLNDVSSYIPFSSSNNLVQWKWFQPLRIPLNCVYSFGNACVESSWPSSNFNNEVCLLIPNALAMVKKIKVWNMRLGTVSSLISFDKLALFISNHLLQRILSKSRSGSCNRLIGKQ